MGGRNDAALYDLRIMRMDIMHTKHSGSDDSPVPLCKTIVYSRSWAKWLSNIIIYYIFVCNCVVVDGNYTWANNRSLPINTELWWNGEPNSHDYRVMIAHSDGPRWKYKGVHNSESYRPLCRSGKPVQRVYHLEKTKKHYKCAYNLKSF